MTAVLVTMALVLVVAVLAIAYAAFPHRGERVPGAGWLGTAVERAAHAVPRIEDGDLDRVADDEHEVVPGLRGERPSHR